jgi:uncharacterized protein (DUF488 family)
MMTIGYEGLTVDSFFQTLHANSVQALIDVRELPLSRKPGFSKSALAHSAATHGIDYTHVAELGCPRAIRHDYKADKDWDRYVRRFIAYLDTQALAIAHLAAHVERERCCLVCYEANYNACHRTLVAERVAQLLSGDTCITHLIPQMLKRAAFADSLAAKADRTTQR